MLNRSLPRTLHGVELYRWPVCSKQSATQKSFVDPAQSFEVDLANVDARPGLDMKSDIQYRVGLIFVGNRRGHFRERIALILESRQQPRARGEHVSGHCRCANPSC